MKMRCHSCGVTKDTEEKETYPFPDDGIIDDQPITPLWVLHCRGESDWRATIVCHSCLHQLNPDMWVDDDCWASIDPATPYEELPELRETDDGGDPYDPELYAADFQ